MQLLPFSYIIWIIRLMMKRFINNIVQFYMYLTFKCLFALLVVNRFSQSFQDPARVRYIYLRKISILVKSRPAMPRVDASPCTTALVIHPTTNRPLSRVLFLLSVWSCWFVHLLFIHLPFLTIGHIGRVYYDYNY